MRVHYAEKHRRITSVFVVGWRRKFIYTSHSTTKIATESVARCFSNKHKKRRFSGKNRLLLLALIKHKKRRPSKESSNLAVRRGLEPLTPCVTGTYSNQLN